MTTNTLTVASFNVKKANEGPQRPWWQFWRRRPRLRDWSPVADLLLAHAPDVILFQELDGTSGKPRGADGRPRPGVPVDTRQAKRLAAALGMHIRIADSPTSTVHTAIAWRKGMDLLHWEELVAPLLHHGQSLAVLHHPTWDHPVSFVGVHFNPFSVPAAAIEAQHAVAHLRRHGPWAILGGDVNAPPLGDESPSWEKLPAYNIAARAVLEQGPLRPNLDVGHTLKHAGLVDVAAHLADQRNDPSLRHPTGAGRIRVDQVHVTHDLADGLLDYQLLDAEGLSDHVPILVKLHLP